jgi:hypothetical protein
MISEISESETVGAGVGGGSTATKTPTLEEYGTNLTKLAVEVAELSPLYCIRVENVREFINNW